MRLVFVLIGVAAAIIAGAATVIFNDRTDLDAYATLFVDEAPQPGKVHVRYGGIATLAISDGETTILTDGFFSRPGLIGLLGTIEPDKDKIDAGLAALGVRDAAAVIPLHSHYDHAMDSPLVAQKTGAVLLGSPSSANIGRGAGLTEDQIIEAAFNQPYRFGAFTVTFFASTHVPLPYDTLNGTIDAPLETPASYTAYKQGAAYSVVITHDNGQSLLVQGSAGFIDGALEGVSVDTVFLGVGGLASQGDAYFDAYWREIVTATDPKTVVPIHWDDLFGDLDETLESSPRLIDDFGATMTGIQAQARSEGRSVKLQQGLAGLLID